MEANVHFPTDLNLLWDALRKCCDLVGKLEDFPGFRKLQFWYNKLKRTYLQASEIHRLKGRDYPERLGKATTKYLKAARKFLPKVKMGIESYIPGMDMLTTIRLQALQVFYDWAIKHVDLVERRIVKGEKIPHKEKVFSLFEPHVEWLQKNKPNKQVTIGHNALVTTDQFGYVVDWKVLEKETDKQTTIELGDRLKERFKKGYHLKSISFDRGFYSGPGEKHLEGIFDEVAMPKPRPKSAKREEKEMQPDFIALRKKHSAVESNINELHHSGARRVPDRTIKGFKKYVGLAILAHNLKRLGRSVIELEALPTVKCHKRAA